MRQVQYLRRGRPRSLLQTIGSAARRRLQQHTILNPVRTHRAHRNARRTNLTHALVTARLQHTVERSLTTNHTQAIFLRLCGIVARLVQLGLPQEDLIVRLLDGIVELAKFVVAKRGQLQRRTRAQLKEGRAFLFGSQRQYDAVRMGSRRTLRLRRGSERRGREHGGCLGVLCGRAVCARGEFLGTDGPRRRGRRGRRVRAAPIGQFATTRVERCVCG